MNRLKTLLVFLTAALGISTTLIGCGGGGGSDTGNPSSGSVTLSGTVTYTYYGVTQAGIAYNSPIEKLIRGAVVALQDSSGLVLATTNTSQTGSYSFSAPANSALRVVVKAALGPPDSPRVTVVDNTNGGALYGTYFDVTTGTANLPANFNANSGWGGTGYSGERAAAPFAVLDTIYQAEALIKSADPNVQFPTLVVNWSKNNKATDGDKTIGEIKTSHYTDGNLYILGAENLDTDEYDIHVMAHEWGHYFEDKLGRSDNIGGSHSSEDILDPRVAFGEGWGNALSGMVLNDPLYIDTKGVSQAIIGVKMNVDDDSVLDSNTNSNGYLVDGFYSEASVQEVLYDLYKSLGFKPIYDVMVGGQKNTPAYTTIFCFLKYLKDTNPTNSTAIAALAAAENIGSGDEYEATTPKLYTVVPVNGTVVTMDVNGLPLQTWADIGTITATNPGNKLFNRMFFKFTISAAGSHTIEVAPLAGGDVFFILNEKGTMTQVDKFVAGSTETLTGSIAAGDYVMEVGSFGGAATFTVKITPQTTTTTPSTPIGVIATPGTGQTTISWNAVSDVTSYNIYWSTSSGVSKTSYTGKISNVTNPYTHTGRTNGTTYYYIVTAVNSYGESLGSSEVLAKPVGTGTLQGYVKDAVTKSAISNVAVSIYDNTGILKATVSSDSSGVYSTTLAVGTYSLIITKTGYITDSVSNLTIAENVINTVETVLQIGTQYSGTGNISGKVTNALDGTAVSSATLNFRAGINVTTGPVVATITTNSYGSYTVSGLNAGNYTGEAVKSGFTTAYFTATVIGGQTNTNQNTTITPILSSGETRIVLTWGYTPSDLDSHLTGPISGSTGRFHVYFYNKGDSTYSPYASLDVDDMSSYGPETITIYQQFGGIYRYSVHDYSNSYSSSSTYLSNSSAQVKAYRGSNLVATFNVPPNQGGTLWTVFEMSGDIITPINTMSYVSSTSSAQSPSLSRSYSLTPHSDALLIRGLPAK